MTAEIERPVRVIRSARRRKTVEARLVDDVLEVLVPARFSRDEEQRYVADMVDRFDRRGRTGSIDLLDRSRRLARRYDLPAPSSVRWVDNQRRRWGSCTIETGAIRISSVLAGYPAWVLDYVLVHELAHLVEARHNRAFHELVSRFPRAERAEGFLIAKGLGDDPAGEDPPATAPTTSPSGAPPRRSHRRSPSSDPAQGALF